MNWKTCFLPLLLAAVMLGSVTAFADGEPAAPETTEPTEIASRETEGSWSGDTYTDNQGIVYELNGDGTITLTDGSNATGSITIPAAVEQDGESYPVTSVGDNAFANCLQLVSVTFSGNIDSIGVEAFAHCWRLVSVTFSGNVGSIGDYAFVNCTALETVTFSGNVDSIWNHAFYRCHALENVTFSGNVGNIEGYAFWDCYALKTIYVPVSTTEDTIDMIRKALEISGLPNVKIERSAPEQPSDPAPSTGTTGSASNAVQQLEAAERPDPMDVEANERYNFWMDVKSDLRAAGDGRTVRVYVPADYTNMPASVMETIRTLEQEVTIDLRWNGQRLIITPQTALQRPARKAFWTFDALCEVYAR